MKGEPRHKGAMGKPILTPRQEAVLRQIAERKSLKTIAYDLRISESAVNQHVKALKGLFGAHSLGDLSYEYRCISDVSSDDGYRKSAYRKRQVPHADHPGPQISLNDEELIATFREPLNYSVSAPW
jgi:DNA-binding CsgD family transcriptional regulator